MSRVTLTQFTNGTTADASAVNTELAKLSTALNGNIDTTNITAASLDNTVFSSNYDPIVRLKDTTSNFVLSGLTIATSINLSSTILAGVAYISGKKVTISNTPITVTLSQDTYVDLKDDGTIVLVPVANNATSGMALTSNSDGTKAIRIAKVVSSATAVVQVLQGLFNIAPVAPNTLNWFGFDALGNAVFNANPNPTQVAFSASYGVSIGTTSATDVATGHTVVVQIPANRKYRVRAKLGQGFQGNGGVTNIFAALYDNGTSTPPTAGSAAVGTQIDLGVYTTSASGALAPMVLEAENISATAVTKNIYVAIHSANAAVTALINTASGTIPLTLSVELV